MKSILTILFLSLAAFASAQFTSGFRSTDSQGNPFNCSIGRIDVKDTTGVLTTTYGVIVDAEVSTGLEERAPEQENFSCYPNPTDGMINISVEDLGRISLRTFSLSGSLVSETSLQPGYRQVDFSDLQPGAYILVLSGSSGENLGTVTLIIH